MINHKRKWLFVHIPKTAGRSIMKSLLKKGNSEWHHPPRTGKEYPLLSNIEIQIDVSDYSKFCFVRNPWDRAVSAYHYAVRTRENGFIKQKKGPATPLNMGFNDFVTKFKKLNYQIVNHYYLQQVEFIQSEHGDMDSIGRFENLQEDFNIVCDKIGIPQQTLPHLNKTKHKHYSEYYDDETREIVAERFKDDIERFGYAYEER